MLTQPSYSRSQKSFAIHAFSPFKHPSAAAKMGNRRSRPLQSATAPPTQPSPFLLTCANPALAATVRIAFPPQLGPWPMPQQPPFVYADCYNIKFWGIEKLHPFDTQKYARVVNSLETEGILQKSQLVAPKEAPLELLESVHDPRYLRQLETSSLKVAMVTELAPLAVLPPFLLRAKVLRPMRTMAGGSVLAGALALERGWAVNLGGGMHHAHWSDGSGWSPYDDISLMLRTLRTASQGQLKSVMVVDLDVHQGNGHERTKLHFLREAEEREKRGGEEAGQPSCMPEIFTVDVYNAQIFPLDQLAKAGIDVNVPLPSGTGDAAYLAAVDQALSTAFHRCPSPQLVVYNAGTDVLAGDPLGRLDVSAEAVLARDEAVFAAALAHGAPVVMLLSGGYTAQSAGAISASLKNLVQKFGMP